jgi:SAM-dependent methyltransferase
MNTFLHGVALATSSAFDLPKPVVEIGAYQVAGQETVADLRQLFHGGDYLGVDVRDGPGVDLVADVEALPLETASVGTVIALSTFEHVPRFWNGFAEMQRVLRPDGVLFVSCPFYFHIHNYPGDYWRFTPQALQLLLQDFPQRLIGSHGPPKRPANVWAVGFGRDYPPVKVDRIERYRELLHRHARERLRKGRWLRYHLARVLCGRGPFAPYLDQQKWNIEFQVTRSLAA